MTNDNSGNRDNQMAELHKLARAMCSIDLAESQWTQVSITLGLRQLAAHQATDSMTRSDPKQELPRLPVPDLWLTVSRYLASLKAVLAPTEQLEALLDGTVEGCQLSREQNRANWQQYEHTDQIVKQFMLNEGPELQRDLKEYANKCQNWVSAACFIVSLISFNARMRPDGPPFGLFGVLFWLLSASRP